MTSPIELLGAPTGNCLRVAIALEEAGLPYVVRRIDLRRGEQRQAAYKALNPDGKAPVIIDRAARGGPFVLSQSNAILFYVAEQAPGRLLPQDDPWARAIAYERFFYFLTDVIAPSHAGFFLDGEGGTPGGAALRDRSLAMLTRSERFLADAPFMAGDQFTLADIAALTIASASQALLDLADLPRLSRWLETVRARPAVQRGLVAFDPKPQP